MSEFKDSVDTPVDKKRKFCDITSPENISGFIVMLRTALKDPAIQESFKGILKDATEVKKLKEKVITLEKRIEDLELRVDEQDQYQRRTSATISGVSETSNENTDDVVLEVAREIGVDLEPQDISRSHRLPSKTKPVKDIVVRFISYNKRRMFYRNRTKLKNSSRFKNVYINDHLTRHRQHLLFECRKAKRNEQIIDTWTSDGKILVKFKAPSGKETVSSITSLKDLFALVPALAPLNANGGADQDSDSESSDDSVASAMDFSAALQAVSGDG